MGKKAGTDGMGLDGNSNVPEGQDNQAGTGKPPTDFGEGTDGMGLSGTTKYGAEKAKVTLHGGNTPIQEGIRTKGGYGQPKGNSNKTGQDGT